MQYYRGEEREKGNPTDRFSGQQFGDHPSELAVSSLELRDTALYLCQQLSTALQGQLPSVHQPPWPAGSPSALTGLGDLGLRGPQSDLGPDSAASGSSEVRRTRKICSEQEATATPSLPKHLAGRALCAPRVGEAVNLATGTLLLGKEFI